MRISSSQINQRGTDAILERQASASKVQLQLSTGKRLLTPSDDPSAAAAVVSLNQSIASSEQYQRNSDFAKSRLQQEESALVSIENVLQRVREMTLLGVNATQTVETRGSIADEMDLLLDDLMALANTRDATNSFLFAGYQDKSQPFTENPDGSFSYLGDSGTRMLQISDNRQIASHDSGRDVFMDITSGNRTFEVADNDANRGGGVIDPGWVTNPAAYDGGVYSVVFPVETQATNSLTFTDNIGTDDSLQYTLAINGTTVYTVDEASTAINTIDDLANQINLSESTTGVRAYVENGNIFLAGTPGTAGIQVTESMTGGTNTDNDEVTGYFGTVLNQDNNPTATIDYDDATVDRYLVVDSQFNIETSGTYQENARIDFAGVYTNIKGQPSPHDSFVVTPSVKQDIFTTVRNLSNAIRSAGGVTESSRAQSLNTVNRELTNLDRGKDKIDEVRSSVGARLRTIDVQTDLNVEFSISIQERRAELEDLDFVAAINRFNSERTALEASQQAYVRMQGLNLFSML